MALYNLRDFISKEDSSSFLKPRFDLVRGVVSLDISDFMGGKERLELWSAGRSGPIWG